MAKTFDCESKEAGSKPVTHPISEKRKEYLRKYRAEYYKKNPKYFQNKKSERITLIRVFILEYLLENPCVDCGERDPIVLEFDHRERTTKLFCVMEFPRKATSLKKVVAEISKCDVRCANCHKRRTYKQLGGKHKTIIGR